MGQDSHGGGRRDRAGPDVGPRPVSSKTGLPMCYRSGPQPWLGGIR